MGWKAGQDPYGAGLRDTSEFWSKQFDGSRIDVRDDHVSPSRTHRINRSREQRQVMTLARESHGFKIDVTAHDLARAKQRRSSAQNPGSRAYIQDTGTRLYIALEGAQTELRRRMPAGPASHAGIDFEAQTARRCSVFRPRGNEIESLPNRHRRPGVFRNLLPVRGGLLAQFRREFREIGKQCGTVGAVIKKSTNRAVFLCNSGGAAFGQFGN